MQLATIRELRRERLQWQAWGLLLIAALALTALASQGVFVPGDLAIARAVQRLHGIEALQSLSKDTPIAFLCHHGGRSQQAAEHFRGLGFREVYNVVGGIDAWADFDAAIPKY